jgi:hypothetical protein
MSSLRPTRDGWLDLAAYGVSSSGGLGTHRLQVFENVSCVLEGDREMGRTAGAQLAGRCPYER